MLFDTHAHLQDEKFEEDRGDVLRRAYEAGVHDIVNVGTDIDTSVKAVTLALASRSLAGVIGPDGVHHPVPPGPRLHAAVGVHPYDGDKVDAATIETLRVLAARSEHVVAFGETGLDFFRMKSSREGQERAMRAHLDLARECRKAAILHLRSSQIAGQGGARGESPPGAAADNAYDAALKVLEDYAGLRVVSHCFSGTPAHARELVRRGFYVSFAGNASYPNAAALREAAREVPLDRIVLETDCPYLTPQPRRGKRNEPAFLRLTAESIARAKGIGLEDLAAAATANAHRLFAIGE